MSFMPHVSAVIAMPTVHEHVRQGAQGQQQPWQNAEEVGGVLGREKEGGYAEEGEQDPSRA